MDQNETTSMTNPYRAALVRLMNTIHDLRLEGGNAELKVALNTARALLAQPVAEGPTDEEIIAFWSDHCAGDGDAGILRLARWGRPAAAPVPVSERLPGPEDCDAEGRCWWATELYPPCWTMRRGTYLDEWIIYPYWLPANALPLPAPEATDD